MMVKKKEKRYGKECLHGLSEPEGGEIRNETNPFEMCCVERE